MTFQTVPQMYALAREAGFSASAAEDLCAIGLAESGFLTHSDRMADPSAIGDVGLEDAKWGPSIGMYQERTLKAESGHGTIRDERWLFDNPWHQTQAAYVTSNKGTNFHPWSTWLHGNAQARLPLVRAILASAGHQPPTHPATGGTTSTGVDNVFDVHGNMAAKQTVKGGVWNTVKIANPVSMMSGPAEIVTGVIYLTFEDLAEGSTVQIRPYTAREGKHPTDPWIFTESFGIDERPGSSGSTFIKSTFDGPLPDAQRLRVEVSVTGQDSATITAASYRIEYTK